MNTIERCLSLCFFPSLSECLSVVRSVCFTKLLNILSRFTVPLLVLLCVSGPAAAHVSEQGFVLLLPTKVYTFAGVAVVVATILALALLPSKAAELIFRAKRWDIRTVGHGPSGNALSVITSVCSLAVLFALILLGWFGSRDPLKNLLPLSVWTFWWIGLVCFQGLVGNVWQWVNPWHGVARWLNNDTAGQATQQATQQVTPTVVSDSDHSVWPALIMFIGFYVLLLVDIAPDDPARLAVIVGAYTLASLVGMALVGAKRWFQSFDFTAVVFRLYGYLAPISHSPKQLRQVGIGTPGWALSEMPKPSISLALFALVMLGCGSFDGINETFWWLGIIGVNPLDFQGRSTIVWQTLAGMLVANLLLVTVFATCVYVGLKIARQQSADECVTFTDMFCRLSLCLLPIALAYHASHFIATFLVNMQYTVAAVSDPLDNGADWLSVGPHYVTTGFLNNHHTVKILWLTQAAMVVFGHVLSILLSHGVAVSLFERNRTAVLSQIPLALFMVAYTFLGLWLLASPRGA